MAYKSTGLSAISYANGFTLWHYRTEDAAEAVQHIGYFDPAHKMLRAGDMIMVHPACDAQPARPLMMCVASNNEGYVAVSVMVSSQTPQRARPRTPEERDALLAEFML